MPYNATVSIVDDDPAVRDVITRLAKSTGLQVETYCSAEEFLASCSPSKHGCLVLDIWLPDMSGMELHEELLRRHISLPVIIISGHGDIPMTVHAMKTGAIDFLEKPFENRVLLSRIKEAIDFDRKNWLEEKSKKEIYDRYLMLTEREREIANLLVAGQHNKEIAKKLNISRRTVESHRAHIMKKLNTDSLSVLTQIVMKLGSL